MNQLIRFSTRDGKTVSLRSVSNPTTNTRDALAGLWEVSKRVDQNAALKESPPTTKFATGLKKAAG